MTVTSSEYRAAASARADARVRMDALAALIADKVADGVSVAPATVDVYKQAREDHADAMKLCAELLDQYAGRIGGAHG